MKPRSKKTETKVCFLRKPSVFILIILYKIYCSVEWICLKTMMLYIHLSFICFVKFVSIEDHETVGRTSWLYSASKKQQLWPSGSLPVRWKNPQRVITRTYTLNPIISNIRINICKDRSYLQTCSLFISIFSAITFLLKIVLSYSEHLVRHIKEGDSGLLLVKMDNGLVMMTGKSQSQTTTSRTISISLTLQAHPLNRMKKSDMLTKHIPPAVSSSKGSHDGRPLHLAAPLLSSHHLPWGKAHPPPHRGWPGAPSTTSQPIHNTWNCSDR